ncbi:hypothetical protein Tco_0764754 [Tanacetum coccineum]
MLGGRMQFVELIGGPFEEEEVWWMGWKGEGGEIGWEGMLVWLVVIECGWARGAGDGRLWEILGIEWGWNFGRGKCRVESMGVGGGLGKGKAVESGGGGRVLGDGMWEGGEWVRA